MKKINCGKANVIDLKWDTKIKKLPKTGSLLTNDKGEIYKVMKVDGFWVRLLQIN
jgi:hypothetical protein